MAIARTSKRLGLRTEASARFERGCDPWGIEPSVGRFCRAPRRERARAHGGRRHARRPRRGARALRRLRADRAGARARSAWRSSATDIARLHRADRLHGARTAPRTTATRRLTVVVPTNRPDVRPEPYGIDDVIEEIARTFGYGNVPRRMPTWPQPGRLTSLQRSRRASRTSCAGWAPRRRGRTPSSRRPRTPTSASPGPAVRVANPLDAEKPLLRRSLLPGLLGALAYNAGRRQPEVRLFEVGVRLLAPRRRRAPRLVERSGAGGAERAALPGERELLSAVFARDERRRPRARWRPGTCWPTRCASTACAWWAAGDGAPPLARPAPDRGRRTVVAHGGSAGYGHDRRGRARSTPPWRPRFGLITAAGAATAPRRVGWLEVDLGLLFDEERVPRRTTVGGAVSRFPSSDIDLAFVVDDRLPADAVAEVLRGAAGELLESVHPLRRLPRRRASTRARAASPTGCASARRERTLTDEEVGALRARCIDAVERGVRRRPALTARGARRSRRGIVSGWRSG